MNVKMNIALKTAIIQSRKKQRRVAKLAHIEESRLSKIIHGDLKSTAAEREALSTILDKRESELFPELQSDAVAS